MPEKLQSMPLPIICLKQTNEHFCIAQNSCFRWWLTFSMTVLGEIHFSGSVMTRESTRTVVCMFLSLVDRPSSNCAYQATRDCISAISTIRSCDPLFLRAAAINGARNDKVHLRQRLGRLPKTRRLHPPRSHLPISSMVYILQKRRPLSNSATSPTRCSGN